MDSFAFQSKGINDTYTLRPGTIDQRTGTILDPGKRARFMNGVFVTTDSSLALELLSHHAFSAGRLMLVSINGELPNDKNIRAAFKENHKLVSEVISKMTKSLTKKNKADLRMRLAGGLPVQAAPSSEDDDSEVNADNPKSNFDEIIASAASAKSKTKE